LRRVVLCIAIFLSDELGTRNDELKPFILTIYLLLLQIHLVIIYHSAFII
jgi:hypothetical protein